MQNKYKFLQPTYYKDFSCSGSECTLNCCNYHWNITVDKETYLKYKSIKEPKEFAENLQKYIKRNRKTKHKSAYGKLVQTKTKVPLNFKAIEDGEEKEVTEDVYITTCTFQDEDGLCAIHKNMGIDGLCTTCKIYPRSFNNIFGNFERSLAIGCEEVSKLFYKNKDGIAFEVVEEDFDPNKDKNYLVDLSKSNSPFLKYFDDVRYVCLTILQLRELSMDNRIILLGAFMFKLNEIVEEKKFNTIPEFMESFTENIDMYTPLFKIDVIREDQFLEIMIKTMYFVTGRGGRADVIFDLHNIMAKFKKAYTNKENKKPQLVSIKYSDGREEFFDEEENKEEQEEQEEEALVQLENGSVISKKYSEYKANRDRLLADKEYYIENLFCHIFYSKGYPFEGFETIKNSYLKFALMYCYYKGILSGFFGEKEEFDEDTLHRVCTISGRLLLDQSLKLKEILKNIKLNNLDNLAFLAVLIKSA